jgi:hypothetical protein
VKLLVDMNLSPSWVDRLARHGFEAVHWSSIGAASAPDHEINSSPGSTPVRSRCDARIDRGHIVVFRLKVIRTFAQGASTAKCRRAPITSSSTRPTLTATPMRASGQPTTHKMRDAMTAAIVNRTAQPVSVDTANAAT